MQVGQVGNLSYGLNAVAARPAVRHYIDSEYQKRSLAFSSPHDPFRN
jgi:hypothetical protein